jgi:hypothetical protein
MENKQQTALTWLFVQLSQSGVSVADVLKKAQEMEKQQIKDAYYTGYHHGKYGVYPKGDDYYHKLYTHETKK